MSKDAKIYRFERSEFIGFKKIKLINM